VFVFEELDLYLPDSYKCEKQSCASDACYHLLYFAKLCVNAPFPFDPLTCLSYIHSILSQLI
jgi:hypothetical protein